MKWDLGRPPFFSKSPHFPIFFLLQTSLKSIYISPDISQSSGLEVQEGNGSADLLGVREAFHIGQGDPESESGWIE